MMHFFFQWYNGAIWSNLLASVIWGTAAFLWTRHHFKKLHRRVDELHAKHDLRHKQLMERLK